MALPPTAALDGEGPSDSPIRGGGAFVERLAGRVVAGLSHDPVASERAYFDKLGVAAGDDERGVGKGIVSSSASTLQRWASMWWILSSGTCCA